ncbi:MAG TPA: hypothetical protein VEM93_04630 [Actinomycetota bacterium]|nr:hypothetical protein [Actinomycetota bacterium]
MTIVAIRDAAVIPHAAPAAQDAASSRRTLAGPAACVVLIAMA